MRDRPGVSGHDLPEGWRVVNSENPQEALREPDTAFRVQYFATEVEATEFSEMLNVERIGPVLWGLRFREPRSN